MCGIAGYLGPAEHLGAIGEAMAKRLRHRGPDGQRYHVLPEAAGVLAHARLSIIDLSDRASQPFVSLDGTLSLTFNGEIYNYRELRAELLQAGVSLRTSSDTEVILELYRLHGAKAVERLNGMFAFAIWDSAKRELFLARDRVGKKPLYYAQDGERFAFASEVKAIFLAPGFQPEMELANLPEYLVFGYCGTPRSFFKGVQKLPPSCTLSLRAGQRPKLSRYYRFEDTYPRPIGIEDAKEAVRKAVGLAVERRLVADVPIGAFLSGGIDSAVVVAEMAARTGPVRTFTAGFTDDATYDERAPAREIAQRFSTQHTELVVSASGEDLFERLLDHHDEPYGDSSALAQFAVAEATREHLSVVLTGDGGDEAFAGYTRFLGGMAVRSFPGGAAPMLRKALRLAPEPRGYKSPVALLRRFLEHADKSPEQQLLAWNAYFVGDSLRELLRPEHFGGLDPWAVLDAQAAILRRGQDRGRDRLDRILHHNLETYLLDDLLIKADRMTMAVGLEARSPFLDTALLELCFSLPSDLKIRHGKLKWILREAYRGLVPDEVLDRKKHGFGVPVGRWWEGALAKMIDELLLSEHARVSEYLQPAAIRQLVTEHRSKQREHGQRIFALVQLELWLRKLASSRASQSNAAA
ncbi:MAG: asparagine synthase (glutamine-hydrolyzing) [Myxococcota bacterium]